MRPTTLPIVAALAVATLLAGCLPPQISATGLGRLAGGATGTTPIVAAGAGTAASSSVSGGLASSCSLDQPATPPTAAPASFGAYAGQMIPTTFADLSGEGSLTSLIALMESKASSGDASDALLWACFNKFYAGAVTVYRAKSAGTRAAAPSFAPSTRPSTVPSYLPSYAPSFAPSYVPSYAPSYVPSYAPSPAVGADDDLAWEEDTDTGDAPLVEVFGYVYDVDGEPIGGATVTARSLDASFPFTASDTSSERGAYLLDVPAGLTVEIMATYAGRSKRRVGSFQGDEATVHFGGPTSIADPNGAEYAL